MSKVRIIATGSDGHKRSTITQGNETTTEAHDRLQKECGKYSTYVEYIDVKSDTSTKKGWWG